MPITKSAIKKLRQDKKRTRVNRTVRQSVKDAIKAFRKNPKGEQLERVYEMLDRAAKKRVIHQNKASRLKSRLSKLIGTGTRAKSTAASAAKKKTAKPTKKAAKK